MKLIIISVAVSSFVGGLVGFACVAFIDYVENNRGETKVLQPTFTPLEAQISIAQAAWAQQYWLKRVALALEIENKLQLEYEEFDEDVDESFSMQNDCRFLENQTTIPHGLEP